MAAADALSGPLPRLLHAESGGAGCAERTRAPWPPGAARHLPVSRHAPLFRAGPRACGRCSKLAAAEPAVAVFVHCGVLTVGVRKKLGLPSPFDMRFSNPIDLHAVALRFPRRQVRGAAFRRGLLPRGADAGGPVSERLPGHLEQQPLDAVSARGYGPGHGLPPRAGRGRRPRLLFGTDSSFFPRGWNAAVFDEQVRCLEGLGIPADDARRIFGGNLQRILRVS